MRTLLQVKEKPRKPDEEGEKELARLNQQIQERGKLVLGGKESRRYSRNTPSP